jgi:hypothetical protein
MANQRESGVWNRTTKAAVSERGLNNAILAAYISQGYEEYLAIFDHFYADDIEATTDTMKEPVVGKASIRALVAGFLMPLHAFAEIGGLSVLVKHVPISGDRSDETHCVWTLELFGRDRRALHCDVVLAPPVEERPGCLGAPLRSPADRRAAHAE